MYQSVIQMDKIEVWDLTEALYTFSILNHSGMYSDLYSLQCEIAREFTTGIGWSESEVETNNIFYSEITESNIQGIWNRVKYYLDNKWDD